VDVSICPFAEWKGPVPNMNKGGMVAHPHGLVPHVIVGSLRSADMIFHQASQQKSAHFGVGKDGHLVQWVDTEDKAWAQAAGNPYWWSAECEGLDTEPHTPAQIDTLGRLTAWLWSVSSFTLQVTNDVLSQGVISHRCGGLAWGAHTCPGDQRHGQRGEIVAKARAIVEHPAPPVVVTPFPGDHMKRLDMTERGLDNSGHGYTDLDVPAFTVVSVRVNTADYAPVPQCVGDQDFGGKARLEWVGPANAPAFSFRAWVAD
jgi:hypothetical protein